jgi:hypothetical protein
MACGILARISLSTCPFVQMLNAEMDWNCSNHFPQLRLFAAIMCSLPALTYALSMWRGRACKHFPIELKSARANNHMNAQQVYCCSYLRARYRGNRVFNLLAYMKYGVQHVATPRNAELTLHVLPIFWIAALPSCGGRFSGRDLEQPDISSVLQSRGIAHPLLVRLVATHELEDDWLTSMH